MKRMNVMIDEALLEEALRLSGERTYSAAINRALRELVRVATIQEGLKILSGSGWWEGNLEEMRRGRDFEEVIRDAPIPPRKPRRRKPRRASR